MQVKRYRLSECWELEMVSGEQGKRGRFGQKPLDEIYGAL
jgi:hypothetical protein